MLSTRLRAPSALLAAFALISISCAKDSPTAPEPPLTTLVVVPSELSAQPTASVAVTVRGATLPATGLAAKLNNTAITIGRLTDSTAVILVPSTTAGAKTLAITFAGAAGSASFTVLAATAVANPAAYLDSTTNDLEAQIATFTDLEPGLIDFAEEELAELRANLAALTPAERALVAMAVRNAAARLATPAPTLRLEGESPVEITANAESGCSCGSSESGSTLEDCTITVPSPDMVALRLGFGAAMISEGVAIGSASPNPYVKAVGGAIAGLGIFAILKTYNDTMCQTFKAMFTGFSADAELRAPALIGLGTYFSDTAYRLNVYGRYQSPSRATADKNLYAGFVMQALDFLEAVWDDFRAKFPALPAFRAIPATPAVTLVQRIPSKYLDLGATTPSAVSGSEQTKPDSTWWVKFSLPGIGNEHPFQFVVEYTGPGAVDTETDYSATLRPDTFPVAKVEIVDGEGVIGIQMNGFKQMEAILTDSMDRVITDRFATWTSSIPATATISTTGLLVGQQEGVTSIIATAETKQDDAVVLVGPIPVDTVVLSPDTLTVGLGGNGRFNVTLLDSLNRVLSNRVVTWESLNTDIATVNSTGLITGVLGGFVTIRATSETKSTIAKVHVIPAARALSSGAAAQHQCAISTGGAMFCWGSNSSGQLGDGTGNSSNVPVATIAAADDAIQVVTGAEHTCALYTNGSAQCWGLNDAGQLGNGTETPYEVPATVVSGGLNFAKLAASVNSTCGITTGGAAYCWGVMNGGYTLVPTLVPGGHTFSDITTGGLDGACGLTTGGSILCWGVKGWDAAGSPFSSVNPIAVGGGRTYTKLAANGKGQCGLSGGQIWCWGYPDAEALGVDSLPLAMGQDPQTLSGVPLAISAGGGFIDVVGGERFTCGLTAGGSVYCWDSLIPRENDVDGSVALAGTTTGLHMPGDGAMLQGAAGGGYTKLGVSRSTVCGLRDGGIPWCWGSNFRGQSGQGGETGVVRGMSLPAPIAEPGEPNIP